MATYDEMINQLSPEQVRQLFNQGYPSGLPQSMTLLDYINPKSYIDPRASDRVVPQNSATQTVAPAANRVSMPNLSGLTDYLPSMNTLSGLVPREIPNVFGVNNPLYSGLLGADQSQALSRQSNIAGLLGAAAALVQGMGKQGSRRSAAQNIISALGAGYGAAGQGYQQGLQNYGQAQQLAIQQRQQAGVQAMKMKYPDLADEFDTNPAGAFRIVSEREAALRKPTVVSQGATLVSPEGKILFTAPSEVKPEKAEAFSGEYANVALNLFGTADVSKLNPEQRAAVATEAQRRGVEKTPKTTVNVSPADKKFSEQFGTATAAAVEGTFNKALAAQNTLSTIATIKPLIKGEVFSGPLSESEATISRLGAKFGITSGTTQEKLNATTQAMQGLAQLELQAAEAMKGQGAITDFERTLIARAAGGDLAKLTQKEVLGLLGALEKVSQKKITTHKTNLERLRKRPDTSNLADFYELEAPPQKLKFNPATGKVE
jgi:hypothetical protein